MNNEIQNNNQNMNISNNTGNNNQTIKTVAIIGIVVLIVILVILVIFLLVKSMNKDNSTDNNQVNDNIDNNTSIDLSKYNFTDIKTYDKSTNGNIVYNNKEWIGDTASTSFKIEREASCNNEKQDINYTLNINNGVLTIIDGNTNQSYTFNKITNIKSAMEFNNGQDCASMGIVILTNSGNIYYRDDYKYIASKGTMHLDFNTLEDEFEMVKSNYSFDKIGYTTYKTFGSRLLGAHTTSGKEVTISPDDLSVSSPYDDNVHAFFMDMYGPTMIVKNDASLLVEDTNKTIVDSSNNKIYINYGFIGDKLYIIDRQGYLYTININDEYELETTTADKYSDVKVKSIGIDNTGSHYSSVILQFENSKNIEIDGSIKYGIN